MRKDSFDPGFHVVTPKGELNLIGVTEQYFDRINSRWTDETQDEYIRDYNTKIFPCVSQSQPADELDEDALEALIGRIRERYHLEESTVRSRIRHLVFDPYDEFVKENGSRIGKTMWGAAHHFQHSEDVESALLVLKKSFTTVEQKRIGVLLEDPRAAGETVGLAVMAYTSARGNEACGLNFRDIRPLLCWPEVYTLVIGTTTEHNSNALKLGGKTQNAPRILPMISALRVFLSKRMEYLAEAVRFPLTDSRGMVCESVEDLPIACKGHNYAERCRSNDLSVAGAAFLRDTLKLSENRVAGISTLLQTSTEEDVLEADPTTYLFRRNFATRMKLLGFTDAECQYYMGHQITDPRYRRSDFMDEDYLKAMWDKLSNFPV